MFLNTTVIAVAGHRDTMDTHTAGGTRHLDRSFRYFCVDHMPNMTFLGLKKAVDITLIFLAIRCRKTGFGRFYYLQFFVGQLYQIYLPETIFIINDNLQYLWVYKK